MDWKTIELVTDLTRESKGSLLRELISNFKDEYESQKKVIKAALEEDNLIIVERSSHKLKGTAYTIGASELAQVFAQLEEQARIGDKRLLPELLSQLDDKFAFTCREFRRYFASLQQNNSICE